VASHPFASRCKTATREVLEGCFINGRHLVAFKLVEEGIYWEGGGSLKDGGGTRRDRGTSGGV
jgi:hypothetical protein